MPSKSELFSRTVETGLRDLRKTYNFVISRQLRVRQGEPQTKLYRMEEDEQRDLSMWMDGFEFRAWVMGFKMGWIQSQIAECDQRLETLGATRIAILEKQA